MYMIEGRKVTRLREQIVEQQITMVKQESEWNKRLKEATKKVTIIKPDGTKEVVETTEKDIDSSGRVLIDSKSIAKRIELVEKDRGSNKWGVSFYVIPKSYDFGSYKNYGFSLSVDRQVFSNFSVGPIVQYHDDRFWFGLGFSYRF